MLCQLEKQSAEVLGVLPWDPILNRDPNPTKPCTQIINIFPCDIPYPSTPSVFEFVFPDNDVDENDNKYDDNDNDRNNNQLKL